MSWSHDALSAAWASAPTSAPTYQSGHTPTTVRRQSYTTYTFSISLRIGNTSQNDSKHSSGDKYWQKHQGAHYTKGHDTAWPTSVKSVQKWHMDITEKAGDDIVHVVQHWYLPAIRRTHTYLVFVTQHHHTWCDEKTFVQGAGWGRTQNQALPFS